ncbi:MAG: hypothetical protein RMJ19_08530 [Gemmatales bacterium]|nr:hypothetical protein [Gemmatales bacterium]MDW8175705.1 hypothetical protein [Gemmatales bacterium]
MKSRQRKQIRRIFQDFLHRRLSAVRELRLQDLDINPFLLRLLAVELGLTNAKAIVR